MSSPPPAAPLVTVAMVTYNSAAYVRDAVESVLAQDMGDFELVVCDDASTDDTVAIVREFRDPRIRVVAHASNLGEYPNRNHALSVASGRHLMYIDGDDLLYPHGLGLMARALQRFPSTAFAAARPWSERFVYPVLLTPAQFYRCQFLGPNVAAINFAHLMFRTDALRAAGGFDARFRSGDTHVQYRLASRHDCVLVSDGISWWRRTPGQASQALLRDGWLAAESARYTREALDGPDCPLAPGEAQQARANVAGVFLRIVARYAARGRVSHALALLRASGLPAGDWRHAFTASRRPYLAEVTAAHPIRGRIAP